MSAINESKISHIQDEDLLKKMWQETEDFGRKKEIRAHMYKLREERLKDLYCNSDVKDIHLITNKKTSFNQSMHADALADHSFASLKRKEIRDSESPTKDVSYRMKGPALNEGWNISKIEEHSQDGKNHKISQSAHTSGTEYIPQGKLDFEAKNSQELTTYHDGDDKNFVKSQGTSSNSFIRQEAVGGDGNSSFRTSSSQSSTSSRTVTEQKSTYGDAIDFPKQSMIEHVNGGQNNNFKSSTSVNTSKTDTNKEVDDYARKQIIIECANRNDQNNYRTSSTNATSSSKIVTEQKSHDDYSRKQSHVSESDIIDKTTKVYTTDAPRELKSHPGYVEGRTKITRETKTLADGTVVTTTKYETKGVDEVKSTSSNQYVSSSSTFQDNKSNVISSKSHNENFSTQKVIEDRDKVSPRNQPKSRYYVEKTHTIPDTTENIHHNIQTRRESNVSEKKFDTTKNFQSHVDQRYEIINVDDVTQNKLDTKNTENVRKQTIQHIEVDDSNLHKKENVRKETVDRSRVQQKTVATHDVNSVPLGTPIEIEINLTRINDNQEKNFKGQYSPASREHQAGKQEVPKSAPENIYDTPKRREPIKHQDEISTKTKVTDGQYDTTYRTDYTTKKISVEVSPTHDAFARSLRAVSPDRLSSRTSSRNLKSSNSSLRSSSSPEKSYLDRRHPQRMSPDRQTNGRYHSPTKKTPEKFSSTETITYKTVSRPNTQRISPDKFQRNKHTNEVKITSNISTKKTETIDDKTYRTSQSPPKNRPRSSIPNNDQYTNVYEITTDLDDNVSTYSHSTVTTNKTDKMNSNLDTKTVKEFYINDQRKPVNENHTMKESPKKDKPMDRPLKRTDTYEERCRQILGITSDTNEKRRSSLEKLRKRDSFTKKPQETPDKKPSESPRQKSPTKQGVPLQEFPSQIRRTPEKCSPEKRMPKEPSPTKGRKPSIEGKPIQEYPSQTRKTPEKPDDTSFSKRPSDNRQERKPSNERKPIQEFPSQIRRTPEKYPSEDRDVTPKPIDSEKRPSTHQRPIGEYPSQRQMSPDKQPGMQSPRSSPRRNTEKGTNQETSDVTITSEKTSKLVSKEDVENKNQVTCQFNPEKKDSPSEKMAPVTSPSDKRQKPSEVKTTLSFKNEKITNITRNEVVSEGKRPIIDKDTTKKPSNKKPKSNKNKPNDDTSSDEDDIEETEVEITETVIYDIPKNAMHKISSDEIKTTDEKRSTITSSTDMNKQQREINMKTITSDIISEEAQISEDVLVSEEKPHNSKKTPSNNTKDKSPSKTQRPNEDNQLKSKPFNLHDLKTVDQIDIMEENITTDEKVTKSRTVGELVESFTLKESESVDNRRKPNEKPQDTNKFEIETRSELSSLNNTPSSTDIQKGRPSNQPMQKSHILSPSKKTPERTDTCVEVVDIEEERRNITEGETKTTGSVTINRIPQGDVCQPIQKKVPKDSPQKKPSKQDENLIVIEVQETITIESDEELDEQRISSDTRPSQISKKIVHVQEDKQEYENDEESGHELTEIEFTVKGIPSEEVKKTPKRNEQPMKKTVVQKRAQTENVTKEKDIKKLSQRTPSGSFLPKKPEIHQKTNKKDEMNVETKNKVSTVRKSFEQKQTKPENAPYGRPVNGLSTKTIPAKKPVAKKPLESVDKNKKPIKENPANLDSDSSEAEEEIHTKKHIIETYEGRTPVEEPLMTKKTVSLLYSDDEDEKKATQLLIESEITEIQPITDQKKERTVKSSKITTSKLINSEKNERTVQKDKPFQKTSPQSNSTSKKTTIDKKPEIPKQSYLPNGKKKDITRKEVKQNTLKDIETFDNVTEDKRSLLRSNRVDETVNKKKTTVLTTDENKPLSKVSNGVIPKRPSSRNTVTVEKVTTRVTTKTKEPAKPIQKTNRPSLPQRSTISSTVSSKTKTESKTTKTNTKTIESKFKSTPKKIEEPEDSDEESLPDSLNESVYSSINDFTSTTHKTEIQTSQNIKDSENRQTSSVQSQLESFEKKQKGSEPVTQKHKATKSIIINNKDRGTVDLQRSISSREPTPDRMCPLPVTSDEEGNAPRYPDKVVEPEESSPKKRYERLFDTSIHEHDDSIQSKKIVEINEDSNQKGIDRVDNDDESLLTVNKKINKFLSTAEKLTEKSVVDISQPAPKVQRPKFEVNDDLKEDDCLLSVSDKVQKFITEAEHLTTYKDTQHRKSVNVEVRSDVTDKINQFTSPQHKDTNLSPRKSSTPKNILPSSFEKPQPEKIEPGKTTSTNKIKVDQDVFITTECAEIEKETDLSRAPKNSPNKSKEKPEHESPKSFNQYKSNKRDETTTTKKSVETYEFSFEDTQITEQTDETPTKPRKNSLKEFTPKNRRPSQEEKVILSSVGRLRSNESIKKAKALFENTESISREEKRQIDILNRPSVFEGRSKTVKEANSKKVIDRNNVTPKRLDFTSEKETKDRQIKIESNRKYSSEKDIPGYMKPLDRQSKPEDQTPQTNENRREPSDHQHEHSRKDSQDYPESQDIPGYMKPLDRSTKHQHPQECSTPDSQEHRNTPKHSVHGYESHKHYTSTDWTYKSSDTTDDNTPGYMKPLDRTDKHHHSQTLSNSEIQHKHAVTHDRKHSIQNRDNAPGYMKPIDRSHEHHHQTTSSTLHSQEHTSRSRHSTLEDDNRKHVSTEWTYKSGTNDDETPGYMKPLDRSSRPQFDSRDRSQSPESHTTSERYHEGDRPGYMKPLDRSSRPRFDSRDRSTTPDSHTTSEKFHQGDNPGYMQPLDRSSRPQFDRKDRSKSPESHSITERYHEGERPGYMQPLDRSSRPQFDSRDRSKSPERHTTSERFHEGDKPGYMEPQDRSSRPQFDRKDRSKSPESHNISERYHEGQRPGYMQPLDRPSRSQFDSRDRSKSPERHTTSERYHEGDKPGYMEPLDRSSRPRFDRKDRSKSPERHSITERYHEGERPGYMEPLDRSSRPQFDSRDRSKSPERHTTSERFHEGDKPGYMEPQDRSSRPQFDRKDRSKSPESHNISERYHEGQRPGYMQPLDRSSRPQFDSRDRSKSPESHTTSERFHEGDKPGYMEPQDRSSRPQFDRKDRSKSPESHNISEIYNEGDKPGYMQPLDRSSRPQFDRKDRSKSPESHNISERYHKGDKPGYMQPLDRSSRPQFDSRDISKSPETEGRHRKPLGSGRSEEDLPGYMKPLDRCDRSRSPKKDTPVEKKPKDTSGTPTKFGVTLKRTDSSKAVSTTTKTTTEKKHPLLLKKQITEEEIDEVFDLEVLEELLLKFTIYELRRKIRTQIRIVKKLISEGKLEITIQNLKNSKKHTENIIQAKEITKITQDNSDLNSKKTNSTRKIQEGRSVERKNKHEFSEYTVESSRKESFSSTYTSERRDSRRSETPEKKVQERRNSNRTTPERASPERKYASKPSSERNIVEERTTSVHSTYTVKEKNRPGESKPPTKTPSSTSTNIFNSSLKKTEPKVKSPTSAPQPEWITQRNLKKAGTNEVVKKSSVTSSSTIKKQSMKSTSSKESESTDLIASSYGIGPTDENGAPLFGLRALRAQNTNGTTKVQGTVISSQYYSETGKEPIGQISVTKYSSDPRDLGSDEHSTRNGDILSVTTTQKYGYDDAPSLKQLTSTDKESCDSRTNRRKSSTKTSTITRKNSVKALTQKFVENAVEVSKNERQSTYPKAGLILRSSSFKNDSAIEDGYSEVSAEERTVKTTHSKTTSGGTFLRNKSKVTGVQDAITRMKAEDVQHGDSKEDIEAKDLLNKYLGTQVILSGIEGQVSRTGASTEKATSFSTSAKSVSRITTVTMENGKEVTRTRTFEHPLSDEVLESVWDEQTLRYLLDQSTDYEERKRIRARLRLIMAEQEACTELVKQASQDQSSQSIDGESLLLPLLQGLLDAPENEQTHDSGTESGEDQRSGLIAEVQNALDKLSMSLRSDTTDITPERRSSLLQLVTKLQAGLSSATSDRRHSGQLRFNRRRERPDRHTIGVSNEELADARKLMQEISFPSQSSSKTSLIPKQNSEGSVNKSTSSYNPVNQKSSVKNSTPKPFSCSNSANASSNSSSVQTPSESMDCLGYLFNEETKDYSGSDTSPTNYNNRNKDNPAPYKASNDYYNATEDVVYQEHIPHKLPNIDSEEDECSTIKTDTYAKPDLLMQSNPIYYQPNKEEETDSKKNRFTTKKLKMRRANTIDIPKPLHFYECDDEEETDVEEEERRRRSNYLALRGPIRVGNVSNRNSVPTLEPKTENDKKFLAFITKHNQKNQRHSMWASKTEKSSIWNNKFDHIKTNFEKTSDEERPKWGHFSRASDDSISFGSKKYDPKISKQTAMNLKRMFEEKQRLSNERRNSVTTENSFKSGPVETEKNVRFIPQPLPVNKFSHAPSSAFQPPTRNFDAPNENHFRSTSFRPIQEKETQRKQNEDVPEITKSLLQINDTKGTNRLFLYSPKPLQNRESVSPTSPGFAKPWVGNTGESRVLTLAAKKFENPVPQPNNSFQPRRLSKEKINAIPNFQSNNEKLSAPYLVKSLEQPSNTVRKLSGQYDNLGYQPNKFERFPQQPSIPLNKKLVDGFQPKFTVPQNYSIRYDKPKVPTQKFPPPHNTTPGEVKRYNHIFHPEKQNTSQYYAPRHDHNFCRVAQPSTHQEVKYHHNQSALPNNYERHQEFNQIGTEEKYDQYRKEKPKYEAQTRVKTEVYEKPRIEISALEKDEGSRPSYVSQSSVESLKEYGAISSRVMSGPVAQVASTVKQKSPMTRNEHDMQAAFALKSALQKVNNSTSPNPNRENLEYSESRRRESQMNQENIDRPHENNVIFNNVRSNSHVRSEERPSVPTKTSVTESHEVTAKGEHIVTGKLPLNVQPSFNKPTQAQVLSKSDSWHQICLMNQAPPQPKPAPRAAPSTRNLMKSKSTHSVIPPKQYEAGMTKDEVAEKRRTMEAFFGGGFTSQQQSKSPSPGKVVKRAINRTKTSEKNVQYKQIQTPEMPTGLARSRTLPDIVCLDLLDENNVDQAFEDLFTSKTIETSKEVVTEGPVTTTKVTRVSTQQHVSKKPMSPFAKFRQLDKQNSLNTPPSTPRTPGGSPLFKFTDAALSQSASTIKDRLLYWCRMKTKEYENIQLDNFSSSWADGLAFCALIHHFLPDAFDYHALTPKERRHNFTLAFKVADEKADIAPLLDVDDMVATMRPDWKCVFTYVQSIYRRFKDED